MPYATGPPKRSPGTFGIQRGLPDISISRSMNTAVCAAIKGQEKVAARRWRRRVSPRTAGLGRAAAGAGRSRASAHLSSAITTASNMSCSTVMALSRLSSGPRTPAILCSKRQPARNGHKRPARQPKEPTSVYAARSSVGKDGKLKKPHTPPSHQKNSTLLRMGSCCRGRGWFQQSPAPPPWYLRIPGGWGRSAAWGTFSRPRAGPWRTLLLFSKSKQMGPNSQTGVIKK